MRKNRRLSRQRGFGIEALEARTLLAGDATGAAGLIGVGWDLENSPVYAIDETTAEAVLIGNSGLGRLNSLAQDAQGTLYTAGTLTTASESSNVVATISPRTGAATVVGELMVAGLQDPTITSMAFSPQGTLYAISEKVGTSDNRLITIDPQTAATTVIATLPHDVVVSLMGLDFAADGTLYGWGTDQDRVGLVTVDPATGHVTDVDPNVGATGTPIQTLVFLDDGRLLGYDDRAAGFPPSVVGDLLEIDLATGDRTLIATIGAPAPDIRGLAVFPTLPDDPVIPVEIDIKPGSDPNSVNLASQGRIAVALLTTDTFDASSVITSSVVFAGAHAVHSVLEDTDGDGDLDLVLHFNLQETNLAELYARLLADDLNGDGVLDSNHQTATVSLTGQTATDEYFEGLDEMDLFLNGKELRALLENLSAAGAF